MRSAPTVRIPPLFRRRPFDGYLLCAVNSASIRVLVSFVWQCLQCTGDGLFSDTRKLGLMTSPHPRVWHK